MELGDVFFSGAALQFYLPVYMIADSKGALTTADPSFRLCAFVTPQIEKKKVSCAFGGGTLGDYARTDFNRFTSEQVAAIVAYLWWKLETESYNPTIEQALENYWLKRETETK